MAIKVFNLRCAQHHLFEGWFSSSEDFDEQRERGLLTCPLCNSTEIERLPSAPYVASTSHNLPAAPRQPSKQPALRPTAAQAEQLAQMQAMYLKMARELVANTEDVGDRFAEEARRIHYQEAPERGIRGVASIEEAQALQEEGIDVLPLPPLPLVNEPLQ